MANQKITDLRSLNAETLSREDLFPVVDVSENTSPTGELKKISANQFVKGINRITNFQVENIATAAAASASITIINNAISNVSMSLSQRIEILSASFSSTTGNISNSYITDISTVIADATQSLAQRIEILSASFVTNNSNAQASIVNTQTALATASSSLAQRISQLNASFITNNSNAQSSVTSTQTALATVSSSLAQQITQLSASFVTNNSNAQASITNTQTALATASSSLAQQITQLSSSFNNSNATISQINTALTTATQSIAQQISNLQAQITATTGLIATADFNVINSVVANATQSLASSISSLSSNFTQNSASTSARITNVDNAFTNASSSLASRITTISASFTENSASTEARITTVNNAFTSASSSFASIISIVSASAGSSSIAISNINQVTASVNGALAARWGVDINSNGRVIGSVKLDGSQTSSSFVVQTDRFLVASGSVSPIALLDIKNNNIIFGADVASDNFSEGSSGWRVRKNGDAEFKSVVIRDGVYVNSIPTPIIDPPSGLVYNNQSLAVNVISGSGTVTKYTVDGTPPGILSPSWPTSGLNIGSSTILRVASYNGNLRSGEANATYTYVPAGILLSTPGNIIYEVIANTPSGSIVPLSGTGRKISSPLSVSISSTSPNVTIQLSPFAYVIFKRGTGGSVLGFDGTSADWAELDYMNPITSTTPGTAPAYVANTTPVIVTGSVGSSNLIFSVPGFSPASYSGKVKLGRGGNNFYSSVFIGTASISELVSANWEFEQLVIYAKSLANFPTGSSTSQIFSGYY